MGVIRRMVRMALLVHRRIIGVVMGMPVIVKGIREHLRKCRLVVVMQLVVMRTGAERRHHQERQRHQAGEGQTNRFHAPLQTLPR